MHAEPKPTARVARLALRLGGERYELEAVVPEGPARVVDVLPGIRAITDAVVRASIETAEQAGSAISCRAGCGACCRQPVPIAESEAVALSELVAAMPEERRGRVEARFAAGIEQLEAHGLLERLTKAMTLGDLSERQAVGIECFRLGIACPFLEDESCSIHADRPLACREYLVTSPAEHCSDPDPDRIELVPVNVNTSSALGRLRADGALGETRMQPLLLALSTAGEPQPEEEEEEARPLGTELFERYVRGLAGGES